MSHANGNASIGTATASAVAATVLIAEDDRSVRQALERALRLEGYVVVSANDGLAALELVASSEPNLVLLDVTMPFLDGFSVCRELRARSNRVPVLMLTARHEVRDRVSGLDCGADDYLVKPFALEELLARVRALLRRTEPDDRSTATLGDLTVDGRSRRVTRGGVAIELTKTEFDLLELLVANAGIVLSRELLYDRIWGIDFETSSKTLDVYIGYLRRKTEEGGATRLVHTVRGIGYCARIEDGAS
jgi:two-component system, OmpR family, response regulator MprA